MKLECGCELTDDNIFKPCRPHWQLLHDASMFKMLTDGEIDYKASIELGVPIVKACPKTWMSAKKFANLTKGL